MAKEPQLKLKEGDLAPDFAAATNGGGRVSLAELRGKHVVLYFYPRDDTPGCTKEACAFTALHKEFARRGAVLLGVSTDPVKSHDKFAGKFKLPFPLLADDEKKIVTAYGVWGEKSFMGRKYMGTHRVTFLIGCDKCAKIKSELGSDGPIKAMCPTNQGFGSDRTRHPQPTPPGHAAPRWVGTQPKWGLILC
ncbi:MAG: peroxiredoxin [Verrucomicrobia bacterium]|nr:peroxiredoxin [Verrucomicrobiota bacterium]